MNWQDRIFHQMRENLRLSSKPIFMTPQKKESDGLIITMTKREFDDAMEYARQEGKKAEREKAIKIVEKVSKKVGSKHYDGNDLRSAEKYYNISAKDWWEIIRLEDGLRMATNYILQSLTDKKEL